MIWLMWAGVGAGVGVGVGVDFPRPESESESESLKFDRLRSPAGKSIDQCVIHAVNKGINLVQCLTAMHIVSKDVFSLHFETWEKSPLYRKNGRCSEKKLFRKWKPNEFTIWYCDTWGYTDYHIFNILQYCWRGWVDMLSGGELI